MKRKQVKKTLSIVLTAAMIGTTNVPVLAADMQPVQEPAVEYGSDAEVPENTDTNDVTSEENVSAQDENSENDAEAVEETVIAEASGVQYETLQEAIDSADEVEVKLLKDTTESVIVAAGKTVTLDLNGHKLTNTDKKNTIENNGTLTITDSGNGGTVDNVSHARAAVVNNYDGTVTLKAGTYTRSQEAGTSSSESGDNSYYTLQNLGTMTIENGVTVNQGVDGNGKYSSLVINGKDQSHTSTMTINGGTFNGGLNSVKNDEGGNLTIAGGNFTNIAQHAVLNWEKTVISGGTFEVTDQATALICNGSYEGSAGKIEITGGNFNAGNAAVFMKFSGYAAGTTEKVSGGTFSKDLDASVLAEGYTTTENEDGTYTVEKETGYQVNVQSRIKGTGTTIANVTGGGSDITTKNGTDVTTTVVSGYEFLGWYENYTVDDIGTLVSKDRAFNYKPEADTTLTAVYQVSEKQTFTLTVGGAGYTVVDPTGSHSGASDQTFVYDAGTKITVKFNNEDESFLYWMNESSKIVSTKEEYTFILGSNTTISAVSVAQDEEAVTSAYVVFLSESQQVMAAEKYTSNSAIDFPEAPYKMGYEFVKWDKTEKEIQDAMSEHDQIRVNPVYKEKENAKYTITVKYDGIEKDDDVYTLQAGNSKYLTAPEVEGMKFQYWKKGNEILSYQSSVTVWGVEDVELTAVYASDIIEKVATVNITGKVADYDSSSGKYKMTFIQNFALGDNNTIVKTGFVYTTKEANAVDDKLVLDGVGIGAGISSLKTKEGSYSYTLKTTNPDLTVYIRAFVQYVDKQGNLQTKYTEIESASYNSIQGGK